MSPSAPIETDVVVVGAGLSGLRAALDLHKAGLSFVVLEAMSRVGGKTRSVDASTLGGKVDIGAAWINNTSQSEMYALARGFGFELIEQRTTGDNLKQIFDGSVQRRPYGSFDPTKPEDLEAIQKFVGVLNAHVSAAHPESPHLGPDAAMLDCVTFEEYAEKHAPGGVGAAFSRTISESYLGVGPREVSALFMVDYIRSGTGFENMNSDKKHGGQYLRNRQGNQMFSVRLAAQLPADTVRLSTPAEKITQQPQGGCLVETAGAGLAFRAKRVIVSVPTTLYSLITFEPPLPAAKLALGDNTALGYYAKTIFVFDRPWWREAGLSGIMESTDGPISFSRDTCSVDDNQYSITCFIVGDSGRQWSKWSAAERRRLVTAQFDAVMGVAARKQDILVPAPINVIEKEWVKDPWARGAPSPVMLPGVLTTDSGKSIRDAHDKIHFIGTETALVWKGYMEGAVRSGIRGAKEVIEALSAAKLQP
ncbi:amine oxidase [Annulohypoxylon bovei var. microspora]|nr:amine oxidase [Annulohypoxylon bovei var. microspora]